MRGYVVGCLILLAALGIWMYDMGRPPHPGPDTPVILPRPAPLDRRRATLDDVRRDWGMRGRLECRVLEVPEDR